MFIALRELRFAKGRFGLIAAVVALLTLLVGFLSGLSGGLAGQNISALLNTKADSVVFANPTAGEKVGYTSSNFTEEELRTWQQQAPTDVTPLGIASVLLESPASTKQLVLFASDAQLSKHVPKLAVNEVALGATAAAEMQLEKGEKLQLAGAELTVAAIVPDMHYSHREVAWAPLATWHTYLENTRQPASAATVLLLHNTVQGDEAASAIADLTQQTATTVQPLLQSLLALESFKSEIGSLGMMIGMLVAISALVVGVFFLVWSLQRQRDIAVLKALGADTGWLVRDALGQALIVLIVGVGLGTLLTLTLGAVISGALPYMLSPLFLLVPAILMVLTGVCGALLSLRQITKADPNTALQAAAA